MVTRSKINPDNIVKGVIVEANELNHEKYDLDMDNAITWSKDNKKIERAIMERGYDKDTTMNINFIRKQYSELDLTCCEITELDPGLLQFPNLTSLTASQNSITKLCNLPPSLEECILSQNQLEWIDPGLHLPSLTYLNVSSNHLDSSHLGNLQLISNHLEEHEGITGIGLLFQLHPIGIISFAISDMFESASSVVVGRQSLFFAEKLPHSGR